MTDEKQVNIPVKVEFQPGKAITLKEFQDKVYLKVFGQEEKKDEAGKVIKPYIAPDPFIVKAEASKKALLEKSGSITVSDAETLQESSAVVAEINAAIKEIETGFDAPRDFFHNAHRYVISVRDMVTLKLKSAAQWQEKQQRAYNTEQEAIKAEENRKAAIKAKQDQDALLKKAEAAKKPITQQMYQEAAEQVVPSYTPIDKANWSKELQINYPRLFFEVFQLVFKETAWQYLELTKAGEKLVIDKYFNPDISQYNNNIKKNMQPILFHGKTPTAVIISEKKATKARK